MERLYWKHIREVDDEMLILLKNKLTDPGLFLSLTLNRGNDCATAKSTDSTKCLYVERRSHKPFIISASHLVCFVKSQRKCSAKVWWDFNTRDIHYTFHHFQLTETQKDWPATDADLRHGNRITSFLSICLQSKHNFCFVATILILSWITELLFCKNVNLGLKIV